MSSKRRDVVRLDVELPGTLAEKLDESRGLVPRATFVRALVAKASKYDASRRDHDCPTCICGRRAPVQGDHTRPGRSGHLPGTISWAEHELAWSAHALRHGRFEDAEKLAERGGFTFSELTAYLGKEPETWVPTGIERDR
jgi:hypothetical protein